MRTSPVDLRAFDPAFPFRGSLFGTELTEQLSPRVQAIEKREQHLLQEGPIYGGK